MDNDLALKIYIKARATPKVVAAFAERREFDKILIYSKQVYIFLYSFNYLNLFKIIFCQNLLLNHSSLGILSYYIAQCIYYLCPYHYFLLLFFEWSLYF